MMSDDPQRIIVQLMQRGATLLSESCPKCGGLQVSYKGKVICPKDDNITNIEQLETSVHMVNSTENLYHMISARVEDLLKKSIAKGTSELELSEIILNYVRALEYIKKMEAENSDGTSIR